MFMALDKLKEFFGGDDPETPEVTGDDELYT